MFLDFLAKVAISLTTWQVLKKPVGDNILGANVLTSYVSFLHMALIFLTSYLSRVLFQILIFFGLIVVIGYYSDIPG